MWVEDHTGHTLGRVDGAWLEDATVLELDGKTKYGKTDTRGVPQSWLAEKARYDDMGNLGLERVRFSLGDLLGRSDGVRRTILLRRSKGEIRRFTGSFRLTNPTGLRWLPG